MSEPGGAPKVLVVDDHSSMAEMLTDLLGERGFAATAACSGHDALRLLAEDSFDAVVTDLRMPDLSGLEVLARSQALEPTRPVIVITAHGALDTAIDSIRRGAYHYLTKPINADELALYLSRALEERGLRKQNSALLDTLRARFSIGSLVTCSPAMQTVAALASRVVDASVPVLITGETGTGKSVLARAIHSQSRRSTRPFVIVNCAALPEHLLESELFGHAKGAFTGATAARMGLVEEAHEGTLLLDEIGEMPIALQAKLLHTLERGVVRAVGSNREVVVDTRIMAATHRNLHDLVRSRHFREDLLYRLEVVPIEMPPLRHRREDISTLVDRFLSCARARHPSSPVWSISAGAMARLLECEWPGNVRQLEHVIERIVLLGRGPVVDVSELPPEIDTRVAQDFAFTGRVLPFRDLQRRYVAWALDQLGGRRVATAERLQIDYKTLQRWLAEPSPNDD